MMKEEKSRAALAVIVLLAASLSGGVFSASSDCSPSATETNSPVRLLSAVVDAQRAEQSQRRHLEALFNRYGENGTISLAGLKRLLQNVGLDRIRTVMVQHHEQPGHHDHHHHHHHHEGHHHHHHDNNNGSHHLKHIHTEPSQPRKSPKASENQDATPGKKMENPESHHNLYDKKAAAAQVETTPVYSAQLAVKPDEAHNRQNGSLVQPSPAGEETTAMTSARADTESQTQAAAVSQGGDRNHDHDHHNHDHDDHDHNHDEHNHNHDDHNHDDHGHNHVDHGHNHDEHDHNHDDHGHNHDDHDYHQDDHGHNHDDHGYNHDDHDHNHDDHGYNHDDHDHNHDDHDHNHDDHGYNHDDHDHNHDDHSFSHDHSHMNQSLENVECLNVSSILSSHGMSQDVGLTLRDFSLLCPALLNQIDFGACILHEDASEHGERDHKHHKHAHSHHGDHNHSDHDHSEHTGGESGKNIATAWVGGFVSITIISLLSLLGVVLIPLMNRVFFKFLLSFLVALAVGTLSGDAFLHLIPHSQGGHHHHHEDSGMNMEGHHAHDEQGENLDGVWKGLTALAGVYFMFLIEHFLTLGKMYKDKKQKIQKKWDQNDKADPEKQPALEETDLKPPEDVETNGAGAFGDHSSSLHGGSVAEEEQVMLAPQVSVVSPQGYSRSSGATAYTAEDCENKCHSHFHDTVGQADSMHHHHHDYHHILHHHHSQNHHPHSHSHSYSEQHFQQAGVATLAWMVIMGDGLHNFSDGLAIGAAFTEGLSSGLSTSVAVFCHELPHELGDFAVLLKAGMTVRQAMLYNMLSAMMAYFGMVTGILIGHFAENISTWIFALTAGLFMYVALVDMVPEMLHNDAGDHGFSHWGFFLLQNAGILLGFCIMLLIAIFEHKIQLDLGY
ncbi:zinc transporter ZIP6-like [Seriola lalandi dorsalis]|uniref:Zinc transporter ZIP6 n=1 Tax=Seriola lalandi dorsalis TaxID=1841481 RepID=A0A3B4X4L9_SERLL|nr:zinc transporter ZIP6-like [Seriola lalandi dorsalis]